MRSTFAALVFAAVVGAQSIPWAPSLETALADARARGTVVLIAIVMPGERGSDEMLTSQYRDPRIIELSRETANLLIEVEDGAVPADERSVRERFLKVAPDAPLAAPHHLFVLPGKDGEDDRLLSSFAYSVTAGQLEWSWLDAIRKARPDFSWKTDERARAPESLLYGEASSEAPVPPPSRRDVHDAIAQLRSGSRDPLRSFESYRIVLRSSDRAALKYGASDLRNLASFLKRPAMRIVADESPRVWHTLAEDYLDDGDPRVREEAARALEQLREPKSLRPLRGRLAKEDDDAAAGRMLRALATCAPTDATVIRQLTQVLRSKRSAALRAQAAAALGVLEDRDAVRELASRALADEDASVRSAAAFAIAARRDPALGDLLQTARAAEQNSEAAGWLAAAEAVLAGGDLRSFQPFAESVLGERRPGDGARQFARKVEEWAERARGGAGRGGDEAPDDKPRGRGTPDEGGR